MLHRAWLFITRFTIVAATLLPTWLAYVGPVLRLRRGQSVDPERMRRLHERHAPRFYRLAVRLRGGLIKVGQIISTRVDMLPPVWTSTLSGLQDRVDPLPWAELEPHVARAYGRSPSEVFDSIRTEPTAAASFGQVHRAITPQREEVALKIRYPDAEAKLGVDLFTLRTFLPLFNFFVPQVALASIYDEIARALRTELDYEQEARFTRIIHQNLSGMERIHVPRVLEEYTRSDVIATTWFEGTKITDAQFLAREDLDRRAMLELVIEAWVRMMYVDGVFQSDPHPGNLLARVTPEGEPEICIVDFGQVKILTRAFHQTLVRSVMAFITRDVEGFAKSLAELGLFDESDLPRITPMLEKLLDRYGSIAPEDVRSMDFAFIRDEILGQLASFRGIRVPQELVLYGRTFALLAGLTRAIDPSVDAFALARPYVMQVLLSEGPPEQPA